MNLLFFVFANVLLKLSIALIVSFYTEQLVFDIKFRLFFMMLQFCWISIGRFVIRLHPGCVLGLFKVADSVFPRTCSPDMYVVSGFAKFDLSTKLVRFGLNEPLDAIPPSGSTFAQSKVSFLISRSFYSG